MTLAAYLSKATKEHWSTGHFNVSESDQFRAICEAAKEVGTPAVVGTSEGEARHLGYLEAVALRDAFQRELQIPVFLNADHHKSVETAKAAINAGYDSVHIDLSAKTLAENIAGTKEIVEYARHKGVKLNIEGEVGYIVTEASRIYKEKFVVPPESLTKPEEAKEFVEKTGVDRLAIAVGNIHGISLDEPALDIERIRNIRQAVPEDVALVLHAGSGIPEDQIEAAIEAGIANIHINTDIRVAYTDALRKTLRDNPEETTPYKFDIPARDALKESVKQKLALFRAINRLC